MRTTGEIHREGDEAVLIERLKRADEAAFDELVRRHSSQLIALAKRILRDEELARDVLQDAFMNAFRAIGHFNGDARLGSWLHRIVVNAALAKLRQRRRHPEILLCYEFDEAPGGHESEQTAVSEADAGIEAPDTSIERRQERDLVLECISRMKESHRTVLTLRYIEGYDTRETAQILGVAPNTVKTRLLRARDAFRDHIESEAERYGLRFNRIQSKSSALALA